jgi:hypothetical protein
MATNSTSLRGAKEGVIMATNSTSSRGGTVAITLILLFDLIAASLVGLFLPPSLRLWVWIGTLVLLTIFILAIGFVTSGSWFGVLIDGRRKMSLSRFQTVLWTVLILSAFQAAALTNIQLVSNPTDALTINIPPEILEILGISLTSLVGKSVILTYFKDPTQVDKNPVSENPADRPGWNDMFKGDDKANADFVDLSKVQMFFFTLVLVLVYGVALASMFMVVDPKHSAITALPALTPSMVWLLGISQGGYLGSKAIKRIPPSVTLTSPANGSTVSGSVTMSASTTGMTVDHVDFFLGGTVVGTATSSPYSTSWDSTNVANGSHTILARAYDTSGQSTDSATATVTVSNTVAATTPPPIQVPAGVDQPTTLTPDQK